MRVGLIGLGMVSDTFVDAIANAPGLELSVVHARTAKSRVAFLERHPASGAFSAATLDDLIAQKPDFVCLATPPNSRAEPLARLVGAGIPILMEKPVERDLAAATTLVELCEDAHIPLGIVFQHRARPVVGELRAALPSLGALRLVEVNVPWWRPQSYYDVPGRGSYARDGGGVLISQAIHTLDLLLTLTGPVSAVTAMSATTGFHDMEAEDVVSAGLVFETGAVGQLFASTASYPGRGETITLHCANGSAHLDAGLLQLDFQDGSRQTIGQAAGSGAGADPMAFTSDWHRTIIEDFAASLSDGRPPMIPGRDALAVHRLIDALERSAKAGRRIDV